MRKNAATDGRKAAAGSSMQEACGGEQSASQGRDEVLVRKNWRLWELTTVWQKSSLSARRRCSIDNRAKLWPKGDNLFPDLQMAIFSFEPRRGSLGLPAPIVLQQGARKSCQLIPPLFQSTERLSAFNYHPIKRCLSFIYRLWFRAYRHCLGIRRNKGVKSLERSLCMGCLIPSPQQQALCCVHRVTATTKGHYMQLNSCSADAPAQRMPIQKEKKINPTRNPIHRIHAKAHGRFFFFFFFKIVFLGGGVLIFCMTKYFRCRQLRLKIEKLKRRKREKEQQARSLRVRVQSRQKAELLNLVEVS